LITRAAVVDYENAIAAAASERGCVVNGLKRTLALLAQGQAQAPAPQSSSWVKPLEDVRLRFKAAATSLREPDLIAAASAFDEALVLYQRTAEAVAAVARAADDERPAQIEQAAIIGLQADARYDKASSRLQRARRSAGLSPSPRFPDPRRGGSRER
jgi:hypothetical protein